MPMIETLTPEELRLAADLVEMPKIGTIPMRRDLADKLRRMAEQPAPPLTAGLSVIDSDERADILKDAEGPMAVAGIDVGDWTVRCVVYGETQDDADQLALRIVRALNWCPAEQPAVQTGYTKALTKEEAALNTPATETKR